MKAIRTGHVLHIGAGRYDPADRDHSTFRIWRSLALGAERYTVVGRSTRPRGATLREDNLTVHLLPSVARSESEFLLTQVAALRIAKADRPNVVVAQCPALGGMAAVRIGETLGSGVLLELHGAYYFAQAPRLSRAGVIQAVAARTLPRANAIRALSHGMKDSLAARYGESLRERTCVLPPRVDLRQFSRTKTDWTIAGRPRILMVGALTERKGQLRLLQALLGRIDAEFWFAGEGPDFGACQELARRSGAADRVMMLGRLNHERLSELMPQCDVLVMYSTTEGTPRAILEAMAVGLPVVTTDAGFCRDIVTPGEEGIVLGPDPDAEIAGVLQTLFADGALRQRLGEAARRRAVREFDAEKVYAQYRELIRETARP